MFDDGLYNILVDLVAVLERMADVLERMTDRDGEDDEESFM